MIPEDSHWGGEWKTTEANPLVLTLDPLNPRIEVSEDASQEEIIHTLLEYEDISSLARKIRDGGLLPGERVIVVEENNKIIVLEGNRRICACQLLLNPNLIPRHFKKSFPKVTKSEQIKRIQLIPADVAPDRLSAQPALTLRHTDPGIRKWSVPAKMRRASRLLDQGLSVEEIAVQIADKPSRVKKTVQDYRLFELALSLPGLTAKEKAALSKPDLKINPYTRLFELSGTKQRLGISFSEDLDVETTLSKREFNKCLKKIVKAILLPYALTGQSTTNTRASIAEILDEDDGHPASNEAKRKKAPTTAAKKTASRKASETKTTSGSKSTQHERTDRRPDRFFESLECLVDDTNLKALVRELRLVEPSTMAISGTVLLRATLEGALRYQLKASGEWKNVVKGRSDPDLKRIVNFCIQNKTVFKQDRASKVLDFAKKHQFIDYLALVAHGEWVSADPAILEQSANTLRSLIQYILSKESGLADDEE